MLEALNSAIVKERDIMKICFTSIESIENDVNMLEINEDNENSIGTRQICNLQRIEAVLIGIFCSHCHIDHIIEDFV